MLTTVLSVSVVMIDVERTGSRAAPITSFTALGKGWSDISASTPPERSPQTKTSCSDIIYYVAKLSHYMNDNSLSCQDIVDEAVLSDS